METVKPTRNILVAVDVQRDFIGGSLAVAEGEQVVAPLNTIAETVRHHGGQVVFTRDWHPGETPHFVNFGGQWPVHCVAGTTGASFHDRLNVQPGDTIIDKGVGQTDGYSGWEGQSDTGETLETIITPRTPHEKVQVFLGGLATDFCVRQLRWTLPSTSRVMIKYPSIYCERLFAPSVSRQTPKKRP